VLPQIVPRGSRRTCRSGRSPGVRIAHIGEVDAPEVGSIARDFRKRCEGKGAEVGLEKSGRHYVDGTTWKYREQVIFDSAKPEDFVVTSGRLRERVRAVGQNGFRVWTGLNDGRESVALF